jgi:hypothetical protein
MILATALLTGSLMATGAQARGGGGGGGGGGHMGGFGGGHVGGFGGDHIGGLGGGHIGGLGADHMAHMDHDHFGAGRRHFVGGYDYGLDCPYNPNYTSRTWPYTCTY